MVLHITPSERRVLQLLAAGRAPNAIAHHLGTTESEVDVLLATLFKRMGAACSSEAVADAVRRGLLSPDDVHQVDLSLSS